MGRTVYERKYPTFKEGDEVYTTKRYKSITANKPYIVLKCYKPPGMIEEWPGKVIEIVTDGGFISKYASDKFKKTEAQIRQDKLDNILGIEAINRKTKRKKAMENLTKEQEDFNRVMDDYGKAMKEYHEGIERNNAPILKAIKEEKGDEWFEELENLMEESEVGGAFKIVSKPSGDKQSSGKLIKWEWVDQCSVGDSGDSWEGTITVKISNGKYLEMPFSM